MKYCIGDVHGCAWELEKLIEQIQSKDSEALFYAVGDLINKGPDSLGVLKLVSENQIQCIRGNHEDWLIRIWKSLIQLARNFYSNQDLPENEIEACLGNEEFVQAFLREPLMRPRDLELIQQFRGECHLWISMIESWGFTLDLGEVLMVHAGLDPRFDDLEAMNTRLLTTIRTWDGEGVDLNQFDRDPAWFDVVQWPKPIVFGHWAALGLVDLPQFKGLDTGCVYGKELTAWCVESGEFFQQKAREIYCPIS